MTDEELLKFKEEYKSLLEKPKRVFEIFSDYFGEDKVDFNEGCSEEDYIKYRNSCTDLAHTIDALKPFFPYIYVWFPEVTVTNEYDESVVIQDLYARVTVEYDGTMNRVFSLVRTTFPIEQYLSDYAHSHLPGISKFFKEPCLGNGPIRITIGNLFGSYDEDLWELFCSELDDYVRVESLSGGPYRRLSNIGECGRKYDIPTRFYIRSHLPCETNLPTYAVNITKSFAKHLLKNKLIPIAFLGNKYVIGMSTKDFILKMSYLFIEWYNTKDNPYRAQYSESDLLSRNILRTVFIKNGVLYRPRNYSVSDLMDFENSFVLEFKGTPIYTKILNFLSLDNNNVKILDDYIVISISSAICKILNFRYGRNKNIPSSDSEPLYYL